MRLVPSVSKCEHTVNVEAERVVEQCLRLVETFQKLLEVRAEHQKVQGAPELVDTRLKFELSYLGEVVRLEEEEERGEALTEH